MTDYDLGKAYGKIEIESDVDTDRASQGLDDVGRSAEKAERSLSGTERELGKLEASLIAAQNRLNAFSDSVSRSTRRLGELSAAAALAGASMAGLGDNTNEIGRNLAQLGLRVVTLKKNLNDLGTASGRFSLASGLIGNAIMKMTGVSKELEAMPKWAKRITSVSAAMTAAGAAIGFLTASSSGARIAIGGLAAQLSGKLVPWINYGNIASRKFHHTTDLLKSTMEKASVAAKTYSGVLRDAEAAFRGFSRGIVGVAFLKSGLKDLKKVKDLVVNLTKAIGPLPLAVAALGAASFQFLPAIASGFLNVWTAVKQLSGALLILPGALASVGAIGATAFVAIKGISQAFKAGFGDAEDFADAIDGLSPKMKDFAGSLQDVKKEYEGFSSEIAETAFSALMENFKKIAIDYLPILDFGMQRVATGLNLAGESLSRFLSRKDTMRDFGILFMAAGKAAGNLGTALEPALDALRNIGTVGALSFANLTTGLIRYSVLFDLWSRRVRADGSLNEWIDRGVQGFRDLGNSIKDFSAGFGALLRTLGGSSAPKSLESMADAAKRFRASMEKASTGKLSDTFSTLVKMSQSFGDHLVAIGKSLKEAFEAALPTIQAFSSAVGGRMVSTIEQVASAFSSVMQFLSPLTSGFGEIIGYLVGSAAAFKILLFAVKPLITVFKLLAGSAMMTGFATGLTKAATAMGKVEVAGGRMAAVAGKARIGLNLLAAAGGPLAIALMAVAAAWGAVSTANSEEQQRQQNLKDNAKESAEAYRDLAEAIEAANGAMSTDAVDALGRAMDSTLEKIKLASEGPIVNWKGGPGDQLNAAAKSTEVTLREAFTLGNSEAANDLAKADEATRKARELGEALRSAGIGSKELSDGISGTTEEMIALEGRMKSAGVDTTFIDFIQNQRFELTKMRETIKNTPDGFIELGRAMDVLRDSSSSAADKLSAVDQALRAMGVLKSDGIENVKSAAEATRELGESIGGLSRVDAQGQSFFNAKTGEINKLNSSAQELAPTMAKFRSEYTALVQQGDTESADALWKDWEAQLQGVRTQLDLTDAEYAELLNTFGLRPDDIKFLVSLEGASQMEADVIRLSMFIDQMPKDQTLTFYVEDQDAINKIKGIQGLHIGQSELGDGSGRFALTVEVTDPELAKGGLEKVISELKAANPELKIPTVAEMKPGEVEKLRQQIASKEPIELPTVAGKPGETPTVPTKPGETPPATPSQTTTEPPKTVTTTVKVEGWESSEGTLKRIKALAESLKSVQANITVKVVGWDSTEGTLNRIKGLAASMNSVQGNITVRVVGWQSTEETLNRLRDIANNFRSVNAEIHVRVRDDATGVLDAVKGKLDELASAAEAMRDRFVSAMNACIAAADKLKGAIDGVRGTMDSVAAGASARGASLGEGFAQGIESKVGRVQAAALKLAEAARKPLPSSPAKIGPFSGRGWTPFRGRKLAEGFAQGIHAGADSAQQASLDMVQKIVRAMDSVRMAFGITPTFFDENRAPGKGGKRYYRDPSVTDEQLAEARKQKKEQEAKQARLDAEKAADNVPGAKEKVSKAEESVQKAEERLQKAKDAKDSKNKAENIESAEESLRKSKENLQKSKDQLKKLEDEAKNSGGTSSSKRTYKATEDEKARLGYDPAGIALWEEVKSANPSAQLTAAKTDHEVDGGYHPKGKAIDVSLDDKEKTLQWAKNNRGRLRQVIYDNSEDPYYDDGNTVASGSAARDIYGAGTMSQHANHVHIAAKDDFDKTGGGSGTSGTSGSGVRMVPIVKRPDGTYGSPDPAWDHLIQRESGGKPDIVQGIQDANSGGNEASGLFQIAKGTWAANGGTQFAPTAGEATPEQQAEIAARIFDKSGGAPWGAGMAGRESEEALRAGLTTSSGASSEYGATTAEASTDTVTELRKTNHKLDQAITIAQNPRSSEGEVIRALQDIDDEMVGMTETEKDALDGVRSEIMNERGLKEYDPYENAPKTPKEWFDTIFGGILQNVLGLYNTLEQGLQSAVDAAHLLVRGLSGTDDVNTLVDGMQNLANAAMSAVSTVGTIVETVGNIAAAVGSAIPGIGQVGTVIGSVAGVVGDVNSVVDFVQEVASIGGRWFGKGLSNLIGFLGGTGELQGQIRSMLDLNDNTIKTWSDRNTADKAVIGGARSPNGGRGNDPNQTGAFRDLNIYQGPGSDPAEMMNNAMFAVAAHSQGVYA